MRTTDGTPSVRDDASRTKPVPPAMTRQHFQFIADVLAAAGRHHPVDPAFGEGWHAAVAAINVRFAEQLAETNERFDHDRFMAACADELDDAAQTFRVSIALGNEAMSEPADVADALAVVAEKVAYGRWDVPIMDANGNRVGEAGVVS